MYLSFMKYNFRKIKSLRISIGNDGNPRQRGQKSMSIGTMSKKLGISEVTAWRIENGLSIPKADTIGALSSFFNVSVGEFFTKDTE